MQHDDCCVPGLRHEPEYITAEQEASLIETFQGLAWPERSGRLALHYGYTFDYKTMGIDPNIPFIEFPDWLEATLPRSETRRPDQVCLQYYSPGTGIPPHVDTHSIYDQLYALSIGAPVIMDFKRDGKVIEVDLTPRSMLQMSGDSRLHWTHGIKKRKRDIVDGQERARQDRWSITYRWLRDGECECGNAALCDTEQRKNGTEKVFRWKEQVSQKDE